MATTATFQGYISNGTSGVAGTILNITTMTTGTIQLGMNVSNASVLANTTVVAFLTGTGTTGTYTVSKSQSVGQSASPSAMTATTAAVIVASDYNYMQTIATTVMGTPSGTSGYNQTVLSSQIPGTTTAITASQWSNLRTDLLNAYLHQGSIGSLPSPGVPTKTTAPTGLVSSGDFSKYLAIANSINANKLSIAASGQSSLVTLATTPRTSGWNTTVTNTITLTWPTAAAAKGFFNSGGNIQFSATLTGYLPADPGYSKSVDWDTLVTNMKTITMNYNSTTCTGSFTSIGSAVGFYQLSTSNTNIFNKTTASPTYTNNQYDIYANLNAAGTILTFSVQFQDNSGQPNPPYGTDELVTGTLTSKVQVFYASGSNVAATYPTVGLSGP